MFILVPTGIQPGHVASAVLVVFCKVLVKGSCFLRFFVYTLRIQAPSRSSTIDGIDPVPRRIVEEIPFLGHIWILRDHEFCWREFLPYKLSLVFQNPCFIGLKGALGVFGGLSTLYIFRRYSEDQGVYRFVHHWMPIFKGDFVSSLLHITKDFSRFLYCEWKSAPCPID